MGRSCFFGRVYVLACPLYDKKQTKYLAGTKLCDVTINILYLIILDLHITNSLNLGTDFNISVWETSVTFIDV